MVLSSGELSTSQTFNPQLLDSLWQQKYQDTYLDVCSFFTAQLTIIIQPDRQWQILSASLNQLVAKILGDHLEIATVKASPLAVWLGGNARPQEGCRWVNMCSHWDRDGQIGQQWFFSSGKKLLRKPSSMISSGGAGLLQAKRCQKPAHWSWALFFNTISLIPTNRQSRTHENNIYWKASTKSIQDQPRTLAFGTLPHSDKGVIYLQHQSRYGAEPSPPYRIKQLDDFGEEEPPTHSCHLLGSTRKRC